MTGDGVDLGGLVERWGLELVTARSPALSRLPERWRDIACCRDAEERWLRAMALWNHDLLELLPRFARTVTTRLADVRTGLARGRALLVYAFDGAAGGHRVRLGWEPTDRTEPALWPTVPAPLRTFLREVHAGFVADDGESCGPLPPRAMATMAEQLDEPAGSADWDDLAAEQGNPLSTRLLWIANNPGLIGYYVSPDLPPDRLAMIYEGDVDRRDFGTALDELLVSTLDRA